MRTLIEKRAGEELTSLPNRKSRRIAEAIDQLAQDPVSGSHFVRSTVHGGNIFVKRVGNHILTYSVDAETDTVIVLAVRKEKDAFEEKP